MRIILGHGASGAEVLEAFESKLVPEMAKFRPELILISAGFDALKEDPMASFELTSADFVSLTHIVLDLAETYSGGRIVSILEGGYDPSSLAEVVEAHVCALANGISLPPRPR